MTGLEQILADLARAQQALRRSSTAFDDAIAHLHGLLDTIAAANDAQGEAIDAIVTATAAGLRILRGGRDQ